MGVNLDEGSQLPRHPLCGRVDRFRDDHDDAEETIAAFQDHGHVEPRLETELGAARQVLSELSAAGVDYDDIVATLEREGIEKFVVAFDELLEGIADKRTPTY
jgi:hypothetical protein